MGDSLVKESQFPFAYCTRVKRENEVNSGGMCIVLCPTAQQNVWHQYKFQTWMMIGSCPVAFKKVLNPATVTLVVASLVNG